MRSTVIDADGNVACPECGAKNNFTSKRSGKAKVLGAASVGVFAVAAPKRLQCQGCGTYLKTGGPAARLASPALAKVAAVRAGPPGSLAVELHTVGRKKIAVIKAIREVTPLGLKDALELVEAAEREPTIVAYLSEDAGDALVDRLEKAGAKAFVIQPVLEAPAAEPSVQPVASADPPADIPSQIRQLAQLHADGVLTDDEFQQKKAELLGRM